MKTDRYEFPKNNPFKFMEKCLDIDKTAGIAAGARH